MEPGKPARVAVPSTSRSGLSDWQPQAGDIGRGIRVCEALCVGCSVRLTTLDRGDLDGVTLLGHLRCRRQEPAPRLVNDSVRRIARRLASDERIPAYVHETYCVGAPVCRTPDMADNDRREA